MKGYANPAVLVTTDWVEQHGDDPEVRLVEVNVDTALYKQAHIPGAVGWGWTTQLCDVVRRDIISRDAFEQLMRQRDGV